MSALNALYPIGTNGADLGEGRAIAGYDHFRLVGVRFLPAWFNCGRRGVGQ
jgi:hypothetical protein